MATSLSLDITVQDPSSRVNAGPRASRRAGRRGAWLFIALVAVTAACGGASATLTTTVTPAPTSIPLAAVTRQELPGMVLAASELDAQLAGLQIGGASGFFDAQRATTHTLDPADTVADVQALGFISGYDHTFSDPRLQVGPSFTSRVYLWSSPESASTFIQRFRDDLARLTGAEAQGITLESYRLLDAPSLGEETLAVEMTSIIENLGGLKVYTTTVLWRRGPLVASASVLVFDPSDYKDTVVRMARRGDERISGVLTGLITAEPYVPPAATVPLPQATAPAAATSEFDLPAMLLGLGDLAGDARVSSEGPLKTPGALLSYHRSFLPADTMYGGNVGAEMKALPEFRDRADAPVWRDLVELAAQLDGFPKYLAQHTLGAWSLAHLP